MFALVRWYPELSFSAWQKTPRWTLLFALSQVAVKVAVYEELLKDPCIALRLWTELRKTVRRSSAVWELISNIQARSVGHCTSLSFVYFTAVAQGQFSPSWDYLIFRSIIEYICFLLKQGRICFVNTLWIQLFAISIPKSNSSWTLSVWILAKNAFRICTEKKKKSPSAVLL